MVVAELGMVENHHQQESPPPAWPDEDDGTGRGKPTSSPPRGCLSGKHVTPSCRAVIDCMHSQAGDAQRGRIFETVDAQEGGEHERQEKDWESRRLGGGLGFGFFAGPGDEHGRRRRRSPLRERLREKEKIVVCRKRTCFKKDVLLPVYCCVADSGFGSVLGWVFKSALWVNVR